MSPVRRSILAALLVTGLLAAAAPSAMAAETYDMRAEKCGVARGNGGSDANGVLYAACGTAIVRFDANGKRLADIRVGTLSFAAVAPSPTGEFLYVAYNQQLKRIDRRADGTYQMSTWKAGRFTLGGRTHIITPRNLSTDEFGYIYASNNGVDQETKKTAETRILKLDPAGTVVTAFGEHGNVAANPFAFYQNRGIDVSRDGRMIFVTSHLQGQIRRFDLQPNGSYAYKLTIGKLDTNCDQAGGLSAVSDVSLDAWNFVYAADTTCGKVKKFTANGVLVGTLATFPTTRLHEIAVTRRGDFFAGEWNRFYTRSAANPVPGPIPAITRPVIDVTAPVLTSVALPANTTKNAVDITVVATDAVGVTHARVANEDGNWGAWKAFNGKLLPHALSAGIGYKAVYVQVRDAAGNEAPTTAFTTTRVVAPDAPVAPEPVNPEPVVPGPGPVAPAPGGGGIDAVAPTLTAVAVPATTGTQAINVVITAADNVQVTQVRFANEDGNWGAWKAFTPTMPHTLSANYSVKGVYTQVRDAVGNESGSIYRTLRYEAGAPANPAPVPVVPGAPAPVVDRTAPTLTAVTMPATTATQTITIGITAADNVKVTQVRFANEDGNWGAWTAFTPTMQHTLTAKFSIKGVYVQVRDAAGNESGATYKTLRYQAG
ncbi:MAG: hypothetical protein JWO69_1566 [Thermoleophilia bacterium]|jgi:sugar lactone lactonase YvrE|nr:hypothetical protein [Thermoleophilia bacterium]